MRQIAERYLATRLRPFWERLRGSEAAVGIVLAALVGASAGLGAVAFREMLERFQWVFFNRGAVVFDFLGDNYVVLLPILGAFLFGPLIFFLAREAKGHGVPEVMEAVTIKGGRIRSRVAMVKALASSICIGSGGSVGREGPIVQIGSSIGSTVGQWLRLPEGWIRTLLLCGAAGGISATFNAPIGGVLFALEVLQRRFVPGNLVSIVISSVTAGVVAHHFLGGKPSFGIPPYAMASNWEILPYILLGIISAFAALAFVRLLYRSEDLFDILKFPGYLKPVLGGIVIGLIGMHYFDIFGVGYGGGYGLGGVSTDSGGVDSALLGEIGWSTLLILMVMKMVATSATLGSGGSGGVFAPSLFIGSMLGGAFGIAVHRLFPGITSPLEAEASGAYALVGMGAFFAAAAHAPITAIIILFEMTRDYALILPLMLAVVISTLVSRNLSRESIYTLKLVRRGVDIHRREEADILGGIRVSEVMTRDFPTVLPSMPVSELISELHQSGHHGFPMVDESGDFVGVVTLEDVEAAISRGDYALTAADVATKSPIVAYPGQSIHDAVAQLGGRDVGRIPVVDRNNPKRLLGVLRRHDIVRAYAKALGNRVVH
ncbi:MAG: chloride channel protein [Dehalococcoidia bacterium]|nr:chloride channel protein [Dehalococcoidia bacterium]